MAHVSVLTRALQTLEIILRVSEQECVPVFKTWRLNERHYGNLTGLNKSETAAKYGEEQVIPETITVLKNFKIFFRKCLGKALAPKLR